LSPGYRNNLMRIFGLKSPRRKDTSRTKILVSLKALCETASSIVQAKVISPLSCVSMPRRAVRPSISSRSLRSAQSRKRVPSFFALAALRSVPQAGPKFRMYHFTFVIFDLDQMKRSKESRSDPGYGLTHTKLCESFFRKGVS
jgi:hypothetical protein